MEAVLIPQPVITLLLPMEMDTVILLLVPVHFIRALKQYTIPQLVLPAWPQTLTDLIIREPELTPSYLIQQVVLIQRMVRKVFLKTQPDIKIPRLELMHFCPTQKEVITPLWALGQMLLCRILQMLPLLVTAP